MPILQSLDKLDRSLFELINLDGHSAVLDPLMSLLRNPDTWIPLYVFMAFWSVIRLKKITWLFVLCTLIMFAFTDSVTAFALKPFFGRIRPCAEPALAGIVRVLDGCGGKYSFPSNHAANHFALGSILVWRHFKNYREKMVLALGLGFYGLLCSNICWQTLSWRHPRRSHFRHLFGCAFVPLFLLDTELYTKKTGRGTLSQG